MTGRAEASRVRLLVDRGGRPTVDVAPAPPPPTRPVIAALDAVPVDSNDPFTRHKTTRRGAYEAASARHPEAEDVILVNDRGEIMETTIATLVARYDTTWVTPPLSSGCLPGVARAEWVETGRLAERALRPADLAQADQLGRLNALRGLEPLTLTPDPPRDAADRRRGERSDRGRARRRGGLGGRPKNEGAG